MLSPCLRNPHGLVEPVCKVSGDAGQMRGYQSLLDHQPGRKPIIPCGLHVVARARRQRRESRRIGAELGAQARRTQERNDVALVVMVARSPVELMTTTACPYAADLEKLIAAAPACADEARPVDPGQRRVPRKPETLRADAVVNQNISRLGVEPATPVPDLGRCSGSQRACAQQDEDVETRVALDQALSREGADACSSKSTDHLVEQDSVMPPSAHPNRGWPGSCHQIASHCVIPRHM
jgi:hypothetical protein